MTEAKTGQQIVSEWLNEKPHLDGHTEGTHARLAQLIDKAIEHAYQQVAAAEGAWAVKKAAIDAAWAAEVEGRAASGATQAAIARGEAPRSAE